MEKARKLPFTRILTLNSLAEHLGVPTSWFDTIDSGNPDSKLYQHTSFKKRNGSGYREITYTSNLRLQDVQKIIFESLTSTCKLSDSVNGFVKGKSIVDNATPHINKLHVLKIDLKDYFHQFNTEMVKDVFVRSGCNNQIAEILAKLCTYNGVLVQGFITSPIISNIGFTDTDNKIVSFLKSSYPNVIYTRYADDLAFSSNSSIPSVQEIKDILTPFVINDQKTVLMRRGKKQYVTGLSVSDDKFPRIPKRYKRITRLLLFNLRQNSKKILNQTHFNQIRGDWYGIQDRIYYIKMVEQVPSEKYFQELDSIAIQIEEQGYSLQRIPRKKSL